MPKVRLVLPSILAGGGDRVREINASILKDIIDYICDLKPEIRDRLISPDGELNRSFNFYVNGVNAYFLKGIETELKDGDEVSVIPALGGGC
ncbi:MAG: MoaD/ThiS family protein [Aigarchaeota archaeon]|nr:MoaD/ThiS family protein [Aigarchaeota archaeon]MCX8192727.1 MoaD/ThiS family protein [Nitrososphaeria archaeon]MDW7985979.1 MoaD/ThiS family protein [Nitrososphaerota archaeon]